MARADNLTVFHRAQDFAIAVERFARALRCESAAQLRRSSASIPDNLAEGAERSTDADFARFVCIAAGSCAEAQVQLRRAHRMGIDAAPLIDEAQQIGWMLNALKRRLTTASTG